MYDTIVHCVNNVVRDESLIATTCSTQDRSCCQRAVATEKLDCRQLLIETFAASIVYCHLSVFFVRHRQYCQASCCLISVISHSSADFSQRWRLRVIGEPLERIRKKSLLIIIGRRESPPAADNDVRHSITLHHS